MLLTRAPLYSRSCPRFLVRLACVRHAASVDSEPGSNSRLKPDDCDRVRRHHHHLVSMSLDVKPEHHHSRLARSTCCQRPFRCRTGRSVRLTHESGTLVRPRLSSKPYKHTAHWERCQPKIRNSFPALEFGELLPLSRVETRAQHVLRGQRRFRRAQCPRILAHFKRSSGGLATLRGTLSPNRSPIGPI